jgi:hypothetical protein
MLDLVRPRHQAAFPRALALVSIRPGSEIAEVGAAIRAPAGGPAAAAQAATVFPSRFRERLGASTFLLNVAAHRRHLPASRCHSALLFGSRTNFAVRSHSAACFKNSSGTFMARSSDFYSGFRSPSRSSASSRHCPSHVHRLLVSKSCMLFARSSHSFAFARYSSDFEVMGGLRSLAVVLDRLWI